MASDSFRLLISAVAVFVACIDLGRVGTVIWTLALPPCTGVTMRVTRSIIQGHMTSPTRRVIKGEWSLYVRRVPVGRGYRLVLIHWRGGLVVCV